MSTPTLVAILVVPMIILAAVTFALVLAYVHRVSRVTAELEAKKKPPGAADDTLPGGADSPPPGPEPPLDQ